ncbi:6475_t:CDS:2, partial [Paraglomus brasilianum]
MKKSTASNTHYYHYDRSPIRSYSPPTHYWSQHSRHHSVRADYANDEDCRGRSLERISSHNAQPEYEQLSPNRAYDADYNNCTGNYISARNS